MSLRYLHPDLKLGLVLVAAAAIVNLFAWGGHPAALFVLYSAFGLTYGWAFLVGSIGGLAVIPAAIWIDRGPPHMMMGAGAVAAAISLVVIVRSGNSAAAEFGFFVLGVGSSVVGSLVFYAIAVKGATRYMGTLIGALGLVLIKPISLWGILRSFQDDSTIWVGLGLALAGTVILMSLLPRVFSNSYETGPSLVETLGVPKVRGVVVWVTAAYSIAYAATLMVPMTPTFIWSETMSNISGVDSVWSSHQALTHSAGISVLLWGIASDFYPVRRLLVVVALLLLPVALALAVIDGFPKSVAGVLALNLVRGGLFCLPWVLLAHSLPTRHFAKIALGTMVVGTLSGGYLALLFRGAFIDIWDTNPHFWTTPVLAIALALVAMRLPRTPLPPPQNRAHLPNA